MAREKPAKRVLVSRTRVASAKVKPPSAKDWLELSLEDYHQDRRPLWGKIRDWWKPSAMGETCDRQTVLSSLGYRGEPISRKLRLIFEAGNAIETTWRGYFKGMGLLLSSNVRMRRTETPPFNGEYDVIVRHPYEGRLLLGEIKSINREGFRKLPPVTPDPVYNQEQLWELPDAYLRTRIRGYVRQIMLYFFLNKEGVHEGFLLFDCKDNQDYAKYALVYDSGLIDRELERLTRLEPYRLGQMLPPCTCEGKKTGLCTHKPNDDVGLSELKSLTEQGAEI